jgi:hypothetical protein
MTRFGERSVEADGAAGRKLARGTGSGLGDLLEEAERPARRGCGGGRIGQAEGRLEASATPAGVARLFGVEFAETVADVAPVAGGPVRRSAEMPSRGSLPPRIIGTIDASWYGSTSG